MNILVQHEHNEVVVPKGHNGEILQNRHSGKTAWRGQIGGYCIVIEWKFGSTKG